MSKRLFRPLPVITIGLALCAVCGVLLAQSLQRTNSGPVLQVFSLTTSEQALYTNSRGVFEPIPSTNLAFTVNAESSLTITFNALASVAASGTEVIPQVFIECQIDGQACQPDSNSITFLYPQFCCDTRSFQWVANNVTAGQHKVQMMWAMGNPTNASMTNRSLVVEAAAK
jgi:hypothetical protein